MANKVDAKRVPTVPAVGRDVTPETCLVFAYAYLMCEEVLAAWKIKRKSTVVAALDGYALEMVGAADSAAAVLSLGKAPGKRVFGLMYELSIEDGKRLAALIAESGEQRVETKVLVRDAHGHDRSAIIFVARGGNVTGCAPFAQRDVLEAASRHHLPDHYRHTLAKVIGEDEGFPPRQLLA